MGTRCSTIGLKGVVIPSKKIDPNLTPSSRGERRGSLGSAKLSRADDKTTDTVRSPENPLGVTIRHRTPHGEMSTEDNGKFGSAIHFNETIPNLLHTTDASHPKRLYQYKKGPLIGKGTYGEVYECLNLNTGELLAVKSFKIHGDNVKISSYIETLKKEITLLRGLGHINIVKYYTSDITEVREGNYAIVDIVLEYVSGGSVRKLLDKFSRLEEKVIGTYIRQVLEGLAYLHLNGIVHRNIKGSNILIDTTGTIKLTDFGCSGRPDRFSEDNPQENSKASSLLRGPAFWSAPEVVMRKSQGKPADVWSVGCVVIEMLTGQPPWTDLSKNIEEFMRQISLGTPPPFPKDISENCRDFLYKTFKFKPEDRPSPLELLDHPFVRDDVQDTSYLEAESIQTYQTFQSQNYNGGKVLDLLNVEQRGGERKYMDLKTNNFVRQQVNSGNLSMSNINLGRLTATHDISSHAMGGSDIRNKLQKVAEVNYEDEVSPQPEAKGSLYKFTRNLSRPIDELKQEEELQSKEERRRKLEEEMAKDLMQVSTGQLSETAINQEFGEREEDERKGNYKKRAPPIPIKNSLFPQEESNKIYRMDDMNNHSKNDMQYLPVQGEFVGQMWNSEKLQEKRSFINEHDTSERVEDLSSHFDRKSTGNLRRDTGELANEEEMKKIKEKLRRQYEEQIEVSLARVNSEKLTQGQDKDGQSEVSDIGDLQIADRFKKNFEEMHSSQFVKINTDNIKDIWKNDESGFDIEKMRKKFEEDLGHFRGVWETHADEIEASGKRSSTLTESEGRSPDDKYISKKTGDSIRREDSSGIIERVIDQEISGDFGVVEIENYKDKEIQMTEEEVAKKLGIINEAEEIKEDSSDEEGGRKLK